MASLKRLFQLVTLRETVSGTLEAGLIAAGNAANLVQEPAMSFEPERYERSVTRGSLSPLQTLPGAVPANLSFAVEVAGHTTHSPVTDPFWALYLEACGFRKVPFIALDLTGAITGGPFYHGETVTGGTSNAEGIVLIDTYDDATEILIYVKSGTFQASETLTGGTSGATVSTAGSVSTTQVGIAFYPASFEEITFAFTTGSGDIDEGDILVGDTSGARVVVLEDAIASGSPTSGTIRARILHGTLSTTENITNETQTGSCAKSAAQVQDVIPSFSAALIEDGRTKVGVGFRGSAVFAGETGQPMILSFEFQGAKYSVIDGVPLPGVVHVAKVPKVLLGVTMRLGNDDTAYDELAEEVTPPCWNSVEFDAGCEVNLRRCMSAAAGIIDAHITDKKPTFNFDPEVVPESMYPFLSDMLNGVSERVFLQWGTTAGSAPQEFTLWTPGAAATAEDPDDRDGFAVSNIDFDLNSKLPGGAGDGQDRELVFLYRVA